MAGRPQRLIAPREAASEWLLGSAELDVGSWSGLDESGPDKLGVGLFFQSNPSDGSIRIISIVPGSSAHKSGLLEIHDQLIAVESEHIFGSARDARLPEPTNTGKRTHVTLDFQRLPTQKKAGSEAQMHKFRVNLMRGSPQYIAYQDLFGPANASQLDQLVLQKREEQKFNSMVEKQLKFEQARFAQAQELRRKAEREEAELRQTLQALQRELYEEEENVARSKDELTGIRGGLARATLKRDY